MTIPATSNWCPDCDEACHGHPTMCTVCGATLTIPPTRITTTSNSTARTRPIPDSVTRQLRTSSNELRNELLSLRNRMDAIRNEQDEVRQFLQDRFLPETLGTSLNVIDDATWLNNTMQSDAPSSTVAATAKVVLESLPRMQFNSENTIFQQCVLELDDGETCMSTTHKSKRHTIPAIPGEFCRWTNMKNNSDEPAHRRSHMSNLTLVVADGPGTGEGGTLSKNTINIIQTLTQQQRTRVILYMNRGGGLSFVQKALLGQKAGAAVCVIGNHLPDGPWPYTMCDSTNEASTLGLIIPTVMISYAHGQFIQNLYREQQNRNSHLTGAMIVQSKDHMECCICTESYSTGCKMIQIQPGCGRYFHEECVLQWLSKHNTCPFCRFALPFEDDEMERYRMVQQRQQDSLRTGTTASDDFYG